MTPKQPQLDHSKAVRSLPSGERAPAEPSPSLDVYTEAPSLASYAWLLFAERWTIVGAAGAIVASALAYLFLATPVYRARSLLQIEPRTQSLARLEEPKPSSGETTPAETETEILRSRTLVGSVVDALSLDVVAEPLRFPIIGGAIARRRSGPNPTPVPFGPPRFAWGGERIAIRRLAVPESMVDASLFLTAMGDGRYRLEDGSGVLLLEGEVGKPASASRGGGAVELAVSELVARPGTQFQLRKRRRATVVDELRDGVVIGETARKSGILVLSLAGPRPVVLTASLDTLMAAYLRQNTEQKSAEAVQSLRFVESQIPIARMKLEQAQSALTAFQVRRTTIDQKTETSTVHDRAVALEKSLHDLELERFRQRQVFTASHPSIVALDEQIKKLRQEGAAMDVRIRELPGAEVDWTRLQRDVSSASDLYEMLLAKAKSLRLVASGTIGDARIIDGAAVPEGPETPRKGPVIAVAILLGGVAGIGAALLRRAFADGVDDPEEIELRTGLAVQAVILHSPAQPSLSGGWGRKRPRRLLAAEDPTDVAIENLRSLRTSLQFELARSRNNIVAIGGPCESVGKSFICANLAWVLASPEGRVLLIDCDLRRGRLHTHFGLEPGPGVTDVLSGATVAATAVRTTENPHLDVLPTGRIPPNPAEVLGSRGFEQLLTWASRTYSVVVVDTPPVLAVTDPALVARLAGVNLIVLRSGRHSLREIALTVKRFARVGVSVHGAVLNDVWVEHGRYGMGRYQKYEFRTTERT